MTTTTLSIPNTPKNTDVISMIENISNDMRTLQEKLNDCELALLSGAIEVICVSTGNNEPVASATSPEVTKEPTNFKKPGKKSVPCEALVFAYELNSKGTIVPARCKRCVEEHAKFCKQHGSRDGKPWKGKESDGLQPIAQFKWQQLGTVNEPSPIFELTKAKAKLIKDFNAKQCGSSKHSSDDGSYGEGKAKKKAPKEKKTSKKTIDMSQVFHEGDVIRHKIASPKSELFCSYRVVSKDLIGEDSAYSSLSGFAGAHYTQIFPNRNPSANGWAECEVFRNGKWINCDTLRV
jgi:hypothetical protein